MATKRKRSNPGWKRYATSYGVYKVKKQGGSWIVRTPDGSTFPYATQAQALKHFANYKRNPARRKTAKRKNAPKSQSKLLKNFTGVVRLNADNTVSIIGTGRKANPGRKRKASKTGDWIVVSPGGDQVRIYASNAREAIAGARRLKYSGKLKAFPPEAYWKL